MAEREYDPGRNDPLPDVPPAELPPEALAILVDDGDLAEIERALREQMVRLPAVLGELDRVLDKGHGNLATALATMLIARFHVARAGDLADRVLVHKDTAGADELADLAAALLGQERLTSATKVAQAALEREEKHGHASYLMARIHARRGDVAQAFDTISRVSPDLLGPEGLLVQARYAVLAGKGKAAEGAVRAAKKKHKKDQPSIEPQLAELERLSARIAGAGLDPTAALDLRTWILLEYGSLLLERAADPSDGGRFGMDPITRGDTARITASAIEAISQLGLPMKEWVYANEGGEVVASLAGRFTEKPVREWRAERTPLDGTWLCMASAATHPHLPNTTVATLHAALEEGPLRTFALVLPAGWRAPLVPDLIGRITGDDELPWSDDEEVADILAEILDDPPTEGLVLPESTDAFVARHKARLRAALPVPRPPHGAWTDETPVPRAR